MQAAQDLINFASHGCKDGNLILTEGSAKLFNEILLHKRESADHEDAPPPEIKYTDLSFFSAKSVKWFELEGREMTKVDMEPGDLFYRTLARCTTPDPLRLRPKTSCLICLHDTEKVRHREYLEAGEECSDNLLATIHWPHTNIRPASELPMRDSKGCPKNEDEPL